MFLKIPFLVGCYQCEFEDAFINTMNWMCIITTDIYIYKIKVVYVDVDKNAGSGDLYAIQNPCDQKICSSNYSLGKKYS